MPPEGADDCVATQVTQNQMPDFARHRRITGLAFVAKTRGTWKWIVETVSSTVHRDDEMLGQQDDVAGIAPTCCSVEGMARRLRFASMMPIQVRGPRRGSAVGTTSAQQATRDGVLRLFRRAPTDGWRWSLSASNRRPSAASSISLRVLAFVEPGAFRLPSDRPV